MIALFEGPSAPTVTNRHADLNTGLPRSSEDALMRAAYEIENAAHTPVSRPLGIVLLSDNRVQHQGLSLMLRSQGDVKVQLVSTKEDDALDQVRDEQPDIVLIDLALEEQDCLAIASTVRREVPAARVVVIGAKSAQTGILAMVRAGVTGFVLSDASLEDLVCALRTVANGGQVLPAILTRALFDELTNPRKDETAGARMPAFSDRANQVPSLTQREREVMQLLAEGLSNKAISERLRIAVHTVKTHVHNVLEKLALNSRLEVAAFSHATREGSSWPRNDAPRPCAL